MNPNNIKSFPADIPKTVPTRWRPLFLWSVRPLWDSRKRFASLRLRYWSICPRDQSPFSPLRASIWFLLYSLCPPWKPWPIHPPPGSFRPSVRCPPRQCPRTRLSHRVCEKPNKVRGRDLWRHRWSERKNLGPLCDYETNDTYFGYGRYSTAMLRYVCFLRLYIRT